MLLKRNKSISKFLGLWTFFLLLILKGAFPNPAAALSTLDSCAAQPACRTALGSELAPSVTAPTGAGWGASTLTTTTATGATSTVQAVAPVAVVGDMRLSGIVAYYIWKQSQNEKAQERAKYRYCATYPKDWVCTPFEGGQGDGVVYRLIVLFDITYVGRENNVQHGGANLLVYGPIGEIKTYFEPYPGSPNDDCWGLLINSRGFYASGHVGGGCPGIGNMYAPSVQKNYKVAKGYGGKVKTITIKSIQVQNADVKPDTNGNPPPLPWKEWPQEKRNLAVDLLQPADWFEFVKEMPVGGVLLPGEKVEPRPGGVITPGKIEDDPNTPEDERLPLKSPDFTNPGNPDPDKDGYPNETDPDDDNDGNPDTSDPAPLNPNIPVASSDPPEQPSDPSNPPENEPGAVTPEVLQGIHDIASRYKNYKCDLCAKAIEEYLKEQNISGSHINLDTPQPRTRHDGYIFDDSLPPNSDAISETGHHEGVAININGEVKVFDNHHPNGLPYEEWKRNLIFDSKIHFGAEFDESGYQF